MKNSVLLFVIALCGTTCTSSVNAEETNRIIGGSPATDNQFPYMVSLQRINDLQYDTRGHRCGGALVTLRHAVTAASCLFENLYGVNTPLNPINYRVFAGAAALTNDTSTDRIRKVESFTVHPNYNSSSHENDIAVIRFDEAFSSNVAQPVPLSNTDANALQISACTSSGWGGQNATDPVSTQLLYLEKTVFEQRLCTNLYSSPLVANRIDILNSMICAIALQNYSSCANDIGNPLVCRGNLNGILIQGHGCRPSILAEVYTRVSSFQTWINSVTSGVSTFQPGMAVLAMIAVIQIITAYVLN